MLSLIGRYTNWLHTRWPAGTVERLPDVGPDGSTNVPGIYVVGDLTGVPLLKLAADSGVRAVRTILDDPAFRKDRAAGGDTLDLAIIGGGVSGMAAALEAQKADLRFEILEASEPFSTIVNFPKGKPIYAYPTDMTPAGELQFNATVKEPLVAELRAQTLDRGITPRTARVDRIQRRGKRLECLIDGERPIVARRVIVAIGRSGNYRKLGIAGEDREQVFNRVHDPKDFCGQNAVIVGGGDSALETAIALTSCGSNITLCYRKAEFSRPKRDNIEEVERLVRHADADVTVEHPSDGLVSTATGSFVPQRPGDDECPGCGAKLRGAPADGKCPGCGSPFHRSLGHLRLMMSSRPKEIRESDIVITNAEGQDETIATNTVFVMIGREPPLDFFRRSRIRIRGEWRASTYAGFGLFLLFCAFLYHWKKDLGIPVYSWFQARGWFPFNVPDLFGATFSSTDLLYTLKQSMSGATFYYTLAYSLCIVVFGIRRIRRRRTPYIRAQTLTLIAIQCLALFILPEILLPWAGRNGWFAGHGSLAAIADQFFERYEPTGHERAYWRSYGFILAWPLFLANVFTAKVMWGWLVVSVVQTFVIIPLIVRRWGKGAYCGWICSCGALAETMGDTHRHKMPHGPKWNRLNMVGQVILAAAFVLLLLRILGWILPGSFFETAHETLFKKGRFLNYAWTVDLMLAGVLGLGCYFWFSGRVWCRFACPLAALMHIYARFSRFRIWADKKKCISCNVCTSVCHQGIDVMNFANKGLPMADPQCVRCSACVQSCPTGVLDFVQINTKTGDVTARDRLPASQMQMDSA